jgi:hypothetical protein
VRRGTPVTDAELERQRKVLHEAFTAGWQAAMAVKVTNPAVLAVIESCFELWLEEEVDERGVLGLPFRRRYDLPRPKRHHLLKGRSDAAERPRTTTRRAPREPAEVSGSAGLSEPVEPRATRPVSGAAPTVTARVLAEVPRQRDDSDSQRDDSDSERAVETSGAGS